MRRAIKILAFTDTHGDLRAAESILALAREAKPDLIVSAGDVTFMGKEYRSFFERLALLGQRVYFVPGNHEKPETTEELGNRYPFLENVAYRTVEVAGLWLIGLGDDEGLNPGGFEKEDIFLAASDIWKEGVRGRKPCLFLTHYPPKGTGVDGLRRDPRTSKVTELPLGDEGGSQTVRNLVEYGKPDLVVCGHYHQCFGMEAQAGKTRILNPGPNGMLVVIAAAGSGGPMA